MHRIADQSFLNSSASGGPSADCGVRYSLASEADDAEIRRLLRETPMPGRISISLEREPNALVAAAVEGDEHHTIIARDPKSNRLIAMGSISIRERYVNGEPTRIGYLGQLRLDRRWRGHATVILRGYQFFQRLHESLGVKLYLTSIASDNIAARQFLERGLRGMPTYQPMCELVTLVFRPPRFGAVPLGDSHVMIRQGTPELMPAIAGLLQDCNAGGQFSPVWTPLQLKSLSQFGLAPCHFRILFNRDRPIACAAIWDQRLCRQAVVRRYPTALRLARVPLNGLARIIGLPKLPPIGQPLALAFVSHVAVPSDQPASIQPLICWLHATAQGLGVDNIAVGLDARDPRLAMLRDSFGGREYRTQLYCVHWEDGRDAAAALDDRLLQPELALL